MNRTIKGIGLSIALTAVAVPASAVTLWEQAVNTAGAGYVNQEFSDFPTFSTYSVVDVNTGPGWIINSISIYVSLTDPAGWLQNVTQANLSIFDKVGALPTSGNNPPTGPLVNITTSLFQGTTYIVTASGLNLAVGPGDKWIGLTPVAPFGTSGQAFWTEALTVVGNGNAFRNPGGGFNFGTDWVNSTAFGATAPTDGAITITGEVVPEPATMLALGLGAAAMIRRRRR
jgi:hypothetical protein